MASVKDFDRMAVSLTALSREQLTRKIKNFNGRFRLDFTDSYLRRLPVDRLRHILLAALLNAGSRH